MSKDKTIRVGDQVKMLYEGEYNYGEVTIINYADDKAKVIFDGKSDLNYDYYPIDDLEKV